MAKTSAERQRDWRRRQADNQDTVTRLTAELATWKAEATRWGEEQRTEIDRLTAALEKAEAGLSVPSCRSCGMELACRGCSQGPGWDDY